MGILQRIRRRVYGAVVESESGLLPDFVASAYVSWRQKRPVHVHKEDGVWLMRFSDGAVVDTRLRENLRQPADQEATACDVFIHDHEVRRGGVIIDVGSGIGTEAVAFSHIVGSTGTVHCFEAHPVVHQCLEQSIQLNALDNVHAHQCAIGAELGSIRIESALDGHISNSIMTTGGDLEVPMVSLDSFCEEHGLQQIELLKMNIEGAETDALRGMSKYLSRTRLVSISCHDFKADRTGDPVFATLDEVTRILEAAGFVLRRRLDDPRPWVRDTLYGSR